MVELRFLVGSRLRRLDSRPHGLLKRTPVVCWDHVEIWQARLALDFLMAWLVPVATAALVIVLTVSIVVRASLRLRRRLRRRLPIPLAIAIATAVLIIAIVLLLL